MLALAFLLQAATPSIEPVPEERAKEVIDMFETMCVEGAGGATVVQRLDALPPPMARRARSEELLQLDASGKSNEGWFLKSPHGGLAALYLTPSIRGCNMLLREADPKNMKLYLDKRIRIFFATIGATVTTPHPDEDDVVDKVPVHRSSWQIDIAGHELVVIASFADKFRGDRQHLMTFSMLH